MFEEDAERLRGAYEAFNEGGVEAFLERLAPEFQLRDRESSPDRAETVYGKEGIKSCSTPIWRRSTRCASSLRNSSTAGDQIVVSLHQQVRGKGSGAEVVGNIAHVWTMRGRRRFRLRIFGDKESALRALEPKVPCSGKYEGSGAQSARCFSEADRL